MELPGECSVERECPPVAGLAVLVPLGRAVATAHWHGTWVYRMLYLMYHVACSCIGSSLDVAPFAFGRRPRAAARAAVPKRTTLLTLYYTLLSRLFRFCRLALLAFRG